MEYIRGDYCMIDEIILCRVGGRNTHIEELPPIVRNFVLDKIHHGKKYGPMFIVPIPVTEPEAEWLEARRQALLENPGECGAHEIDQINTALAKYYDKAYSYVKGGICYE